MGVTEFAYGLKWFFSKLMERPVGELKKLFGKLFEKKTSRVVVIVSVVLAMTVPLVIMISLRITVGIQNNGPRPDAVFEPDPINARDLFIPDEPDFLPSVILEQKRKTVWTGVDAAEFWTDPLEFSDEFWQQRVSQSIDRLLEPLP
jgi:hypothetical protein